MREEGGAKQGVVSVRPRVFCTCVARSGMGREWTGNIVRAFGSGGTGSRLLKDCPGLIPTVRVNPTVTEHDVILRCKPKSEQGHQIRRAYRTLDDPVSLTDDALARDQLSIAKSDPLAWRSTGFAIKSPETP